MRYREQIYHRMKECYDASVQFYLDNRRPATMREISAITGIAVSYVHTVMHRLEEAGFVEKSGDAYVPDCVGVEVDRTCVATLEQFRNVDLDYSAY